MHRVFTDDEIHSSGGFPGGAAIKNPPPDVGDTRRLRFDPWVRKTPWRRKWQPTLVFLPGKSHRQRSSVATVHGIAELNITRAHTHARTHPYYRGESFLHKVN